ncbi:MAG: peptidylprolyl isomerase [Planctomycetota bacterium]
MFSNTRLGTILVVCIVSAAWFHPAPASAQVVRGNKIEAVVNDKVVTRYDVFQELDKASYDKMSASEQKRDFNAAVQNLVLGILREEAAKKAGVKLSEEQVRGSLTRYIDARWGGEEGFESFLNDQGLSEKSYIEDFRRQQRTQAWLRVVSGRGAAAKLSEDLRPLYDITVTPKEMRTFYRLNRDELFSTKDEIKVRYIKMFYKRGNKKSLRKVKQRMRGIKASLATKADFAVLAEKYSDDVATKDAGGDIGWIEKGKTDKVPEAIEKLLFAEGVKAGDILGPKHLVNAYWLMKVDNIKTARTKPFTEVQADIRNELVRRKNKAALTRVLSVLVEKAYIRPPRLKVQIKANLASQRRR